MRFTIPVPTFRTYVNVYISKKQRNLNKWNSAILNKFGEAPEAFTGRGSSFRVYINEDGFRCADIIIDGNKIDQGVIAHEALHCTFRILEYCDIELDDSSEETFTCLLEYLVMAINNEYES